MRRGSPLNQINRRSLFGRASYLLAAGVVGLLPGGRVSAAGMRQDRGVAPGEKPPSILEQYREGMQLENERGEFQRSAGRWLFRCDSNGAQFLVLENLGLQRVAEQAKESPDDTRWTASGLITEFRGARYLLLSRAVQRASDPDGTK